MQVKPDSKNPKFLALKAICKLAHCILAFFLPRSINGTKLKDACKLSYCLNLNYFLVLPYYLGVALSY